MPDLETYSGFALGGVDVKERDIGFGPLKGPYADKGGGGNFTTHAQVITQDAYAVQATTVTLLGLSWDATDLEEVSANFSILGTASVAANLRVEMLRGEEIEFSWLTQMPAGVHSFVVPFVISQVPAGVARWRMQLRCDAGTFSIAPGDARWSISRKI